MFFGRESRSGREIGPTREAYRLSDIEMTKELIKWQKN